MVMYKKDYFFFSSESYIIKTCLSEVHTSFSNMNILTTKDILDLSICRCRSCQRRLRYPIMEIAGFGNVCGNCYETTLYTNAVRNNELCTLMEKLHFSCYYEEDGCTFNGSFQATYEHERRCQFRIRRCPFIYQNECDKKIRMSDIAAHIDEDHADNILVVEDEILLAEEEMLYTFYQLSGEISNLKFHSIGFDKFDNKGRLMCEYELRQKFDVENAFRVDLKSSRYIEKMKIYFSNNIETVQEVLTTKIWWQCRNCLRTTNTSRFCSNCRKSVETCRHCNIKCCSDSKYNWNLSEDIHVSSAFVCKSTGCNQLIRGDKYLAHKNYQCRFISRECLFCIEHFTVKDMIPHILNNHKNDINLISCLIQLDKPIKYVYINDVDAFVAECSLPSSTKHLSIKMIKFTEPNWDADYVWKMHIKKHGKSFITTCTNIQNLNEQTQLDDEDWPEKARR
ncbi:Seven in absentia protein family [Popillia japonica]|uniref:Seven in absentia protein family n=1 Tax=Popillia japonica TaxID=7064 RepID=A0AAW1IEW4_POPJA